MTRSLDIGLQSSANIVIVGCAAVDITAQEFPNTDPVLAKHSTAPGHVKFSLGGVARNVAEATHRILEAKSSKLSSILLAPVGKDPFGQTLVRESGSLGMRTDGLLEFADETSAICNIVLKSDGTLVGGVADMGINKRMTADAVGLIIF